MNFVGRSEEIKKLESVVNSNVINNALIYGRRRVGKSELLNYFLSTHKYKHVYYQCIKTNHRDNLNNISKLISDVFKTDYLTFNSLQDVFSYLISKAKDETIILVLDEYTYWRDLEVGFDSELQKCLDQAKNSKLKVIICGSLISSLEKIDEEKAPLFGRFQLKMKIEPFDYYDSSLFLSNLSNEAKVYYYACFGGLPYSLSLIDNKLSFKENIINLYLSKHSYISSFIESTVKEEISKVEFANSIMLSIARGFHKYVDILSQSQIRNNVSMDRALEVLLSLNIIKKEAPINQIDSKKRTLYFINDNSINFYYRYVFSNKSFLLYMNEVEFYNTFIISDLKKMYVPHKFEDICKEFLIRMNKSKQIKPAFYKIGKYYFDLPKEKRNGELDIVTEDKYGYRSYEVKFTNSKTSLRDIILEQESLNNIPLGNNIRLGFFSKNGYLDSKTIKEGFYTLDDIYSLIEKQ